MKSVTQIAKYLYLLQKNKKIIWILQIKYVYLHQHPKVVELVDTPDLESGILIRMYGFESRL